LLSRGGEAALAQTLRTLQPISLIALLATLVLLFGFQGEQIVRQPLIIALLAVPIIIQVYLNAGIAYALKENLNKQLAIVTRDGRLVSQLRKILGQPPFLARSAIRGCL
jgi:ACR3 family arsenite efflux pump ArsB